MRFCALIIVACAGVSACGEPAPTEQERAESAARGEALLAEIRAQTTIIGADDPEDTATLSAEEALEKCKAAVESKKASAIADADRRTQANRARGSGVIVKPVDVLDTCDLQYTNRKARERAASNTSRYREGAGNQVDPALEGYQGRPMLNLEQGEPVGEGYMRNNTRP